MRPKTIQPMMDIGSLQFADFKVIGKWVNIYEIGTVKNHVHSILVKGGLSRPRSLRGANTAAGIERVREAQRRPWQRWRAARSADNA
jgi:hypothetical protein